MLKLCQDKCLGIWKVWISGNPSNSIQVNQERKILLSNYLFKFVGFFKICVKLKLKTKLHRVKNIYVGLYNGV